MLSDAIGKDEDGNLMEMCASFPLGGPVLKLFIWQWDLDLTLCPSNINCVLPMLPMSYYIFNLLRPI